jgi:predicted DNA-binding transcriptional regulator AlpA
MAKGASPVTLKQQPPALTPDRVLTLDQFCELNGIGRNTGKRLIATGNGPAIVQLSPRRMGIRESDAAAWQAARIRGRV